MKNDLRFSLVPISGTLKETGGYRAKFGKGPNSVVTLDEIIKEAKEDGAFFGIGEETMKLFFCGVLRSIINHTASDGQTRRVDDYLSVSLKVHGKFDSADEDFDETKHSLSLSLRPLKAFRPEMTDIRPVNINRKRLFRIYSIAAADGSTKSGEIAWRRDFVIRGDDLLQKDGTGFICIQMRTKDNTYLNTTPEIVSATNKEIVCHWPVDFEDEFFSRGSAYISVDKLNDVDLSKELFKSRTKSVRVVRPEPAAK